ncbi:hypothetical protein ACEQPO_30200 [Bacillus sp. SL00103]
MAGISPNHYSEQFKKQFGQKALQTM